MRSVVVAFVVAVVLGTSAIVLQRREPAPAGRVNGTTAGAANVPDSQPVDPAPYLSAFPLTPPVIPPVAGTTPVDRALERALVPMRAGDYPAAATALDGLLLDHPGETRAQLYLGIARLFQDEPHNALEHLRPLEFTAPPEIAAEAAWYSLVGIARLRDPSSVEPEARTLCQSTRATSARACAALDALGKAGKARP